MNADAIIIKKRKEKIKMTYNIKKEKEVIFTLFNRYENLILNSQKYVIFSFPEECKIKNLLRLAEEINKNAYQYPKDKLCRWIGYIHGVLFTYNSFDSDIIKSIFLFDNSLTYENIIEKSKKIENLLKFSENFKYCSGISLSYKEKENILNLISDTYEGFDKGYYSSIYQHQVLGYIQGIMACFSIINVKEERDYTRPLLHSYHEEKIKSF